jgi:phytochrome-interacting factor 3
MNIWSIQACYVLQIDKASMLDEAIEYLKTLQLQVQMMSMGTGLCIPPMLLPTAMQHLQIPPMAHFPHLGMGLGYGMGVFDMSNTGALQMPPMPGAHFPCPMIPGASPQGLGIPGTSTMPMFGVPGQTIPSSASSVPPFASLAGLPVRPSGVPQVSGAMANMVQDQQQGIANQQQQCLNKEAIQGANPGDSQMQIIMQVLIKN